MCERVCVCVHEREADRDTDRDWWQCMWFHPSTCTWVVTSCPSAGLLEPSKHPVIDAAANQGDDHTVLLSEPTSAHRQQARSCQVVHHSHPGWWLTVSCGSMCLRMFLPQQLSVDNSGRLRRRHVMKIKLYVYIINNKEDQVFTPGSQKNFFLKLGG